MPTTTRQDLTRRQQLVLIVWGIAVWLSVALAIHFAMGPLLDRGVANLVLFALSLPVGVATVWLTARVAGLAKSQLVAGVALSTAAAIPCDGLALTWFPALYGAPGVDVAAAAAWLLWAAGLLLAAAFAMAR